ncbi:unnamed protein product, partial [Choristocarpus tenellus]
MEVSAQPESHVDGQEWGEPSAILAARLDFKGKPRGWEVTAVRVTTWSVTGCPRESSVTNMEGQLNLPVVVLGHANGTSVWVLTEKEAACTHLTYGLLQGIVGTRRVDVLALAPMLGLGNGLYIMAAGLHDTSLGQPFLDVWKAHWPDTAESPSLILPVAPDTTEGVAGSGKEAGDLPRHPSPCGPMELKSSIKKVWKRFAPTGLPKEAVLCLCFCGATRAGCGEASRALGRGDKGEMEDQGKSEGIQVVAVITLGVKALCMKFDAEFQHMDSAKALPMGCTGGVITSLAPVSSNPLLVFAALPSSGLIILWDVPGMQLLCQLPLSASSLCSPV